MYIVKQRDPRSNGYARHPFMVINTRTVVAVDFAPTREAAQEHADRLNKA